MPGAVRSVESRAAATLDLWEALSATTPAARGAIVLVARGLAANIEEACDLPLASAAAAALAELRSRSGPELATVVACPACEALLDVPLRLDDFATRTSEPEGEVRVRGVVVRAPTTADVLAALDFDDPAQTLRDRCETWPSDAHGDHELAARVAEAAERLAGAAGVTARLTCPECGNDVEADVDVVRLLAERVADQARAVLADVATLAAAYGWSEREILTMSPVRRRSYLDLVLVRSGG
jgi:hypothetical protein